MAVIAPRMGLPANKFGKAAGPITIAVLAVLAVLLVAGCVEAPSATGPGPTQHSAPGDAIAALPPDAAERDTPPSVTIEGLMGADEARLHRLLGQPQFRRNDPPARLLRYRAAGCLLDLFLYPKGTDAHRVTHIQARGRDGMDRPAPPCLDAILDARKKAKAG